MPANAISASRRIAAPIALAAVLASASAAAETYVAHLSGAQETPPNTSAATGTFTLNLTGMNVTCQLQTSLGVPVTAAVIQIAPAGTAGPIIVPLTVTGPDATCAPGTMLTDKQVETLRAGGLYVNAGTAAFPTGEIRGQIQQAASTHVASTYRVTSGADDGSSGTLRWAIEQNNANPGGNLIEIQPPGGASDLVIELTRPLPPITGPARVIGRQAAGTAPLSQFGTGVVLDGSAFTPPLTSACPGTTSGSGPNTRSVFGAALSVIDSGGVEISGLEIQHFCIGILSLRSSDNWFHHNLIHDTVGAAGIEITGDDGTTAGGATKGLSVRNVVEYNVLVDTGDAIGFDRGSAYSVARRNVAEETGQGVAPRSQGIELAGAGNEFIQIVDNSFVGFSDGLQLNSGSDIYVAGNTIEQSTYGITTSGTRVYIIGNVIRNNRMGIGPSTAARATITRNAIYANGQPILSLSTSAGGTTDPASPALLGIDVGVNGPSANDTGASCGDALPDCDAVQNGPVLGNSSWSGDGRLVLNGTFAARPNTVYRLEFFANHNRNAAGFAEGEVFVGELNVVTDAAGNAAFSFTTSAPDPLGDGTASALFTATATNLVTGSTSEFSPAIAVTRGSGS